MKSRKLTLTKDTLHELSADDLSSVVGGITTILIKSVQDCSGAPTLPVVYCATRATQ